MKTAELHKTIETLIKYNVWRRDGGSELPDPRIIGEAIDHATEVLMAAENLIEQKGRYNSEIAYVALENAARVTK